MTAETPAARHTRRNPPDAAWGFAWGLALILAIGTMTGAEFFWRAHGYRPNVTDSLGLWAYHRSQLGQSDREVACLGTSRTVCGFATQEFYRRFPEYNLRVLAVSGRKPAAALFDLARDPDFCGTVLCDLTWSDLRQANWTSQQDFVDYTRHSYGFAADLETRMVLWLQQQLVILNPDVRLDRLARAALRGRLPPTGFHMKKADRTRLTDYHLDPREVLSKRRKDEAMFRRKAARRKGGRPAQASPEWLSDALAFREPIQQIRARGGRVIFVRYPTCGERLTYSETYYPREVYWDQIGQLTSAETIHYADYPGLDPGELPDMSHLDRSQSPAFTNVLLDLLQSRGVLPSRGQPKDQQPPGTDYAAPLGRIAADQDHGPLDKGLPSEAESIRPRTAAAEVRSRQ